MLNSIMKAGSRLGTCLLMVVDETQGMVSATRNLEEFFARESCGFCTPCRDGFTVGGESPESIGRWHR